MCYFDLIFCFNYRVQKDQRLTFHQKPRKAMTTYQQNIVLQFLEEEGDHINFLLDKQV